MTEFSNTRKKPSTYGKGTRKILVHDLFDVASTNLQAKQRLPSPVSHDEQNDKAVGGLEVKKSKLKSKNPTRTEQSRPEAFEKDISSKLKSAASQAVASGDTTDASLFELESSDNETRQSLQAPLRIKRRKMAPKLDRGDAEISQLRDQDISDSDHNLVQGRRSQDIKQGLETSLLHRIGPQKSEVKSSPAKQVSESRNAKSKNIAKSSTQSQPRTTQISSKVLPNRISIQRKSPRPESESPPHFSDHSSQSNMSKVGTPKRKRPTFEDMQSDDSSPSQIELSSLRLTPDRRQRTPQKAKSEGEEPELLTPRRSRRRLIDMLDEPQQHTILNNNSVINSTFDTASRVSEQSVSLQTIIGNTEAEVKTQPGPTKKLQKESSSSSVNVAGKPRTTYGKQRSHLSEMVDGLQDSSGASTQRPTSHIDTYPSLALQMELEDNEDGDDQLLTGQLKSIHELRKTGANNRFDRDLESLLDDLAAESKGLSLQALIQLIKKLEHSDFKQHVLDGGKLARLTAVTAEKTDASSAFLMTVALTMLSSVDLPSMTGLVQIYDTLQLLAPRLIRDNRSFSKVIKDRKENISKSMIRDLLDLEQHLFTLPIFQIYTSDPFSMSQMAIQSIENTLRKLILLNYPVPRISQRLLDYAFTALDQKAEGLTNEDDTNQSTECVRLFISWFEMSSARSEDWVLMLTSDRGGKLGRTLAKLMAWAKSRHAVIEQSILRLLVGLSNNHEELCKALGSDDMLDLVFSVIEENFLTLADCASKDQEIDSSKLDSVILALGCLLNFVDCDEGARINMSKAKINGQSQVERLVQIFNRHIDETTEAVTLDQTQVLVAFGYLSMLLCTLCLDNSIRGEISTNLRGSGLERLFEAVETFLSHMQAIEGKLEEDTSTGTFSTRFNSILGSVKQSLA